MVRTPIGSRLALLALGLLGLISMAGAQSQPAKSVVTYSYDAAGNIITMQRTIPIASFTPTSGPVGASVVISGSIFSATPSANIVRFNGSTPATVTAASTTQLTALVPAGATTGPISVTVGIYTAVSNSAFTVTATYGPPAISSVTPACAASGATVTVDGVNFNPAPGALTLKLGSTTITPATIASNRITL